MHEFNSSNKMICCTRNESTYRYYKKYDHFVKNGMRYPCLEKAIEILKKHLNKKIFLINSYIDWINLDIFFPQLWINLELDGNITKKAKDASRRSISSIQKLEIQTIRIKLNQWWEESFKI